MSQISLSHQFSRRWSVAPKQVKDALVQELDDIVQLLDNSTVLEEFKFAIPDLDDYIETVYAEVAQQQATMTPAPKTAMTSVTLDGEPQPTATAALAPRDTPDHLAADDDSDIAEASTASRVTPIDSNTGTISISTRTMSTGTVNTGTVSTAIVSTDTANTGTISPTNTAITSVNTSLTATTSAPASASTDAKSADLTAMRPKTVGSSVIIQALDSKGSRASNDRASNDKEALLSEQTADTLKTLSEQQAHRLSHASATAAPRAIIDDTLLKELEANIDDYLTERLTDISEDLKSWLREQVKQHNQQAADDHS